MPNPKRSFFRFATDGLTLDFLPDANIGVAFPEAQAAQFVAVVDGDPLPFISLAHLLQGKQRQGRPQDLADIAALKRIHKLE